MSEQNKARFTVSTPPETKTRLDEIAERHGLSRSATVTRVLNERDNYRDELNAARNELDETRQEVDQLRGQLEAERERAEQAEGQLMADGGLTDDAKADVGAIVDSQVAPVHRTVRFQTAATGAGLVYIAAVAGDLLGGPSAVAFGVLILAGLVAAFVFAGGRNE